MMETKTKMSENFLLAHQRTKLQNYFLSSKARLDLNQAQKNALVISKIHVIIKLFYYLMLLKLSLHIGWHQCVYPDITLGSIFMQSTNHGSKTLEKNAPPCCRNVQSSLLWNDHICTKPVNPFFSFFPKYCSIITFQVTLHCIRDYK